MRAVFIRAPWIAEHGPDVEVLAEVDGHPVAAREGNVIVVSFHPELSGDDRLHRVLISLVADRMRPDEDGCAGFVRADEPRANLPRPRGRGAPCSP